MRLAQFKLFSLLLFLFLLNSCEYFESSIQEITSYAQVQKELDNADETTLVVFDVDDTLTYNVDTPFQPWFRETEAGKKFWEQKKNHIQRQKDPVDYEKLIRGTRMLKYTDQPLETRVVEIIKNLQARGVQVIALTYMNTGSLRRTLIPSLPQWRWQKLHEIGIELHPNVQHEEVWLTKLASRTNRHPLYYKGIILSDQFEKGPILGEFLDVTKLNINKVIFFDDMAENVKSVHQEMKKRSIAFKGYIYRAIDMLPKVYNQKILDFQLQHLKECDEFISDEEARKALYQIKAENLPIIQTIAV